MKVQVIYSSLSGRTKKVAEAIFNSIEADEKTIHDLKDGEPTLDGDIVLMGYWVDKGGPNAEMKEFMTKVKGKAVGVFCTLGFYADSTHAQNSIAEGVKMVADDNTVIGSYVCNGSLSDDIINSFRKRGSEGPHSATPANEIRWAVMAAHPTKAECDLAAERFTERVKLYTEFKKQGVEFTSIK